MSESAPNVQALVPPSSNGMRAVSRLIVTTIALVAGTAAVILNEHRKGETRQAEHTNEDGDVTPEAALELAELTDGRELIGRTFFVRYRKNGVTEEIPIHIEREQGTNDLIFHVNGKIFRNNEVIPVTGVQAARAIQSIICLPDQCMRLKSHYGHADVRHDQIRRVAQILAETDEVEITFRTWATFTPAKGSVASGGQSILNSLGGLFGKPAAGNMHIDSVTFRREGAQGGPKVATLPHPQEY